MLRSRLARKREDRLGRLIAFGVAAIVLALSAIAGTVARTRATEPTAFEIAEQQAAALRTGAILIVAPNGHPCQRKSIDNETWMIRDEGAVDCDSAILQITSSQRQKWSTQRAEAIRAGLAGR